MKKLSLAERIANRKTRTIRGYCHTAVRKLVDIDYRNGATASMVAIAQPIYEREIQPFVETAMTQVAAIHVPARAVKLYLEGCK